MKYTARTDTTLLDLTLAMYHGISKQKAKKLIAQSRVELDGKRVNLLPSAEVKAGQTVVIEKMLHENRPVKVYGRFQLKVLFEDEWIIVVVKPAGLLSADAAGVGEMSCHKQLEHWLTEREEYKQRLWVVHRLDREVEGIIMFAKSENIQWQIKDHWQEVKKGYVALTLGKPEKEHGTYISWLRDGPKQKMQSFPREVPGAKEAITHYKYVKELRNYHLMEVSLLTGRKNQIRVHLAEMGCPIVGDRKYGDPSPLNRQVRLAACTLEFNHPVNGKKMEFTHDPIRKFFAPSEDEDESYK